jgi:ATP-dependent Clp protease ATP-binding subunit ClpC
LTSNIGAQEAAEVKSGVYGFGGSLSGENHGVDDKAYEEMREKITAALKERFRPEFLNRLDDVIVFHRLSKPEVARIAEKLISSLSKRLFEQRGITLSVTESALSALVDEGYDPQYGARPLKRVVQRHVEDKLSEELLLGNVCDGQKLCVDFSGGEYQLKYL